MELSRQRLKPSLGESAHIPCPRCHGIGHIRGTESIALHILRIIQEEAMKDNSAQVIAQMPVDVATFLLNEKREDVRALEARLKVNVTIVPNAHMETPNYLVQRLRHDDLNTGEAPRASYVLADQPEQVDLAAERKQEAKQPRQEAAVKAITPATPAPVVEPAPTPAPTTAPAYATRAVPTAQPKRGFWGSIKAMFGLGDEPAAAPPPAATQVATKSPERVGEKRRDERHDRKERDGKRDRNDRGDREGRRDRNDRSDREPKRDRNDRGERQERKPEGQSNQQPKREPRGEPGGEEKRDRQQPQGERRERGPKPPKPQQGPATDGNIQRELAIAPITANADAVSDPAANAASGEERGERGRGRRDRNRRDRDARRERREQRDGAQPNSEGGQPDATDAAGTPSGANVAVAAIATSAAVSVDAKPTHTSEPMAAPAPAFVPTAQEQPAPQRELQEMQPARPPAPTPALTAAPTPAPTPRPTAAPTPAPTINFTLPADSGLQMVETKADALAQSIVEPPAPAAPKRVRPPRIEIKEEPLQQVETGPK
jgi:ribonuclease E